MKKIRAACSELAPMRSLHPLSFLVCDGQAAGSRMLDGGGAAAAALPPLTSDIATVDASTKLRIMLRDMRFAVFILRNAPCWLRLLRPGGTLCVCSARSAPSVLRRSLGGAGVESPLDYRYRHTADSVTSRHGVRCVAPTVTSYHIPVLAEVFLKKHLFKER